LWACSKTASLIVQKLVAGEPVHVFESQWDAFAFLDVTRESSGVIVARGAGNGALVCPLLAAGSSTAYVWTQNDEPGKKFAADISLRAKCKLVPVAIPAQYGDLNDWTRAGATAKDLSNALAAAQKKSFKKLGAAATELAAALDEAIKFLTRYVHFSSDSQPIIIALWCAHTWAFDAAYFTPYLQICSPEKRCGKTQLLDCLEQLVKRPWRAVSVSDAVLYRKITAHHPTLLLDEVDTIFCRSKEEGKEGFRAMLNEGFRAGGKVCRCGGANNDELLEFNVFCAKAFAGIGKLPDTITDRSLQIALVRRAPDEKIARFRYRDAQAAAQPLREAFETWASHKEIIDVLREARPDLPEALSDRNQDIGEPLLAIADMVGGTWSVRARNALVAVCALADEVEGNGVKLLRDVRALFNGGDDQDDPQNEFETKQLLERLINLDTDGPWAGWWEASINAGNTKGPAMRLARLLSHYGIKTCRIGGRNDRPRGYARSQFEEVWKRYS
jgi:hypothetical protein